MTTCIHHRLQSLSGFSLFPTSPFLISQMFRMDLHSWSSSSLLQYSAPDRQQESCHLWLSASWLAHASAPTLPPGLPSCPHSLGMFPLLHAWRQDLHRIHGPLQAVKAPKVAVLHLRENRDISSPPH